MFYEIRVKEYMGVGSVPLNKFFKHKENAEKMTKELNELLPSMPLYFVEEVEFQDEK